MPTIESAVSMDSLFRKVEANTGENFYASDKEYRNTFKLEQNNEFIFGTTAGVIGATFKYGFNEFKQVLNIAKYDNNATSLGVVMKGFEYTPIFWVFGFITSLIIGAFFGLIIAFMYTYIFSTKYYFVKSIGIGVGIWLLNFGVAPVPLSCAYVGTPIVFSLCLEKVNYRAFKGLFMLLFRAWKKNRTN